MAVNFDVPTADLDVTSLHHRRATHRWERTSVGDLFERMTWSFPDREALVGQDGAYGDEAFHRVSYAQADEFAEQRAAEYRDRGLTQEQFDQRFTRLAVLAARQRAGELDASMHVVRS